MAAMVENRPATGGGTQTKSLDGSISGTGAPTNQANKAFAGSATAAGVATRSSAKTLAGSSSATGALAKSSSKPFAGSTTGTGVLTVIRAILRTVTGSITGTGTVTRSAGKALSGSSTGSGVVARSSARVFTGSSTGSGAIQKSAGKALSGSSTGSGVVTTSHLILKALSGSITAAATLARKALKAFSGSSTGSGALAGATTGAFATTVSGRVFLDQFGQPLRLDADSPWSLCVRLTTTEMDTYCANRKAKGFNAIGVYLLCNNVTAGFNAAGATYDSLTPLGSSPDFANAPSQTSYWARIDTMFTIAESYGLTVLAFPAEHQGWGSFVVSQGSTKCTNYGAFLGNRYKTRKNIIWGFGDDYGNSDWAAEDPRYLNILSGIKSTGDTHLVCVQLHYFNDTSFTNPTWDSHVDFSTSYTYTETYDAVLEAYNDAQVIPCGLIEGGYELETNLTTNGSRLQIRHMTGWTFLAGGAFSFYGHRDIWQFNTATSGSSANWTTQLNTGAQNDIGRIHTFLDALDWDHLIPDQGTTFITSGRGTYNGAGAPQGGTYCGCARTADGLLAVIYMPTSRSFTLNTGLLAGSVSGFWFDPTSASTVAYTGPTHPGANSVGDGDWFLVLNGTSGSISPSGTITGAGLLARLTSKVLGGSVGGAGVVRKAAAKPLAGSSTATGSRSGQSGKVLAGSVSGSGSLVRASSRVLAGSVSAAGALRKLVGKAFSGSSTGSGVLAFLRVAVRAFDGAIQPVGDLGRSILKTFTGSSTGSGSVARAKAAPLSGSISGSGGLARKPLKGFSGTVVPAGTVSTVRAVLRAFSGAITANGGLSKLIGKAVFGSSQGVGSTGATGSGSGAVTVSGSISGSGSLSKFVARVMSGALTMVGSLAAGGGADPNLVYPISFDLDDTDGGYVDLDPSEG